MMERDVCSIYVSLCRHSVLFLYLRWPLADILVISLAGTNLAKESLIWVKGKEIFFNTKAIAPV
jgi:hypothetical protein